MCRVGISLIGCRYIRKWSITPGDTDFDKHRLQVTPAAGMPVMIFPKLECLESTTTAIQGAILLWSMARAAMNFIDLCCLVRIFTTRDYTIIQKYFHKQRHMSCLHLVFSVPTQ